MITALFIGIFIMVMLSLHDAITKANTTMIYANLTTLTCLLGWAFAIYTGK